jgi:hypothetical protein
MNAEAKLALTLSKTASEDPFADYTADELIEMLNAEQVKEAGIFGLASRALVGGRKLLRPAIGAVMGANTATRAAVGAGLGVAKHYLTAPKDANGNRQGSALMSGALGAAGGVAAPHLIKGVMSSDKIRGGIYGKRANPFAAAGAGATAAAPSMPKSLPGTVAPAAATVDNMRDVTPR